MGVVTLYTSCTPLLTGGVEETLVVFEGDQRIGELPEIQLQASCHHVDVSPLRTG